MAEEKKIPVKPKLPRQVETNNTGSVYSPLSGTWEEAHQSVFRPSCDYEPIDIASAGIHEIVFTDVDLQIRIVSIFFTVAGEVNITLYDGGKKISGPMDFGAEGEPRGIVIPFPYSPLELTVGNSFKIELSANIRVSGSVCYYYQ